MTPGIRLGEPQSVTRSVGHRAWLTALPPVSLAVSAFVAVSAGQAATTTLPALVPLLVIQYWTPRRPRALPVWLVWLCGLFVDVYAHGPLGNWALIAVIAQQTARFCSEISHTRGITSRWGELFAVSATLAVATAMQAVIAMCFAVPPQSLPDAALSLTGALVLYPAIAIFLGWATPRIALVPTGPKRMVFGRRPLFAARHAWVITPGPR